MSRILVTGAKGQLGKEFEAMASSYKQYEFILLAKEDFPIHHENKVTEVLQTLRPQYLINCAAYTAVDKAETEKALAFEVNATAPGMLARVCWENNTKFIHISTDYVFDGKASTAYSTDSIPNPQGVYGASKLEGEKLVMSHNPESIIIRTSWVYSSFGKNFVKTMLRLMNEKEEINVVNDQLGSPTYAADLAEAILQMITAPNWGKGLYHYSNEGVISWFDFALAIKEIANLACKVNPIPTEQYPTPAKRPAFSVLDNSKIQQVYSIQPIPWKESLARCLTQLIQR